MKLRSQWKWALRHRLVLFASAFGLTVALPSVLQAIDWQTTVGAERQGGGRQALAFLPNEVWIHTGDRITWQFDTDELHTVTFLRQEQARPFFQAGCPGVTSDPFEYQGDDATTGDCVNSGTKIAGQTYTVRFNVPGNFQFVCLLHSFMTGTVHVLDLGEPLPFDQSDYDRQRDSQRKALLQAGAKLAGLGKVITKKAPGSNVAAGIGEIVATGGGFHTVSLMLFSPSRLKIRAGETVEWTNFDPTTPHTISFNTDSTSPNPFGGVTVDSDDARRATLVSPFDVVHSGFLIAGPPPQMGDPPPPSGSVVTRFRVTFNNPGIYDYICTLHEDLGMVGRIVVK